MLEKDFEEIICKYSELIEDDLILISRQLTLYGRRMDILFEDKFKRKLIIELKAGPIKDEHIGQILSYEGMLLSAEDPTIRVMLVGTRVPPNIQRSLDHHGIAWKEINFSFLKEFIKNLGDESFMHLFEFGEPIMKRKIVERKNEFLRQYSSDKIEFDVRLVERLKIHEDYKSFTRILDTKKEHEEIAKKIIKENLGNLKEEHLKEVIRLIDGVGPNHPYRYENSGKINGSGRWFGPLLSELNTKFLFNEDDDKINKWFEILSDYSIPVEKRIDKLKIEPYKIKNISIGFISLMLYILDKDKYSIWFEKQHNGLILVCPQFVKWSEKSTGTQYCAFNDLAKRFLEKFSFEPTELDWVLAAGLPNLI